MPVSKLKVCKECWDLNPGLRGKRVSFPKKWPITVQDLLQYQSQGRTIRQIAETLGLTERHVYRKLKG